MPTITTAVAIPAVFLERYKQALRDYDSYTEGLRVKYAASKVDLLGYDSADYKEVVKRSDQLSGMAEVLGLSADEEKEFEREAGFFKKS